jgi:hypothetical protein
MASFKLTAPITSFSVSHNMRSSFLTADMLIAAPLRIKGCRPRSRTGVYVSMRGGAMMGRSSRLEKAESNTGVFPFWKQAPGRRR